MNNDFQEMMRVISRPAIARPKRRASGSLKRAGYVPPKSPIEAMIDAATGYVETPPTRPTKEQKEAAESLASDVMSDLRYYYPDVLKNRPTTWPTHLRNTIAAKAAQMLAAHNDKLRHGGENQ